MFEDITKLGSGDPKIGKAAALNIIKHVQQNKTELGYLVKRLISGLESLKIQTRTGCYTTLSLLLHMEKIDSSDLFDMMQKALITNKQSTKKERRLIYIARILCSGSILKSTSVDTLVKQDVLKGVLHEVVDLSLKKAGYFQLATPFLTHLVSDESLTQEVFDGVVWPEIRLLFDGLLGKKRRNEEGDEEEDLEDVVAVNYGCCVQIALCLRNRGYGGEFSCLGDVGRIVKALLVSKLQFENIFLKSLFKSIKDSSPDIEAFWTTLLENVKPTQFELLCLSVEMAVEEGIPLACLISKRLVSLLLGVFKTKETEFHARSKSTIRLLLDWYDKKGDCVLSKKERKNAMRCLFGGEAPNLLHEYKKLSCVVRSFIAKLKGRELETLGNVIVENLGGEGIGVRMGIVYLNVLSRICVSSRVLDETFVNLFGRLVFMCCGKEVVVIKGKEDEDFDEGEVQGMIKACARDGVKSVMGSCYNVGGVLGVWDSLYSGVKGFCKDETMRVFKDVKKALKKVEDTHMRVLLVSCCVRVLVDEGEVLGGSSECVEELISCCRGGVEEIVKFLLRRVVREVSPFVYVEGMFSRLMIEGRVTEGVVQELVSGIELGDDQDGEEDEEDDDESEDSEESEEEEPETKKIKLDAAQIAKLKETFGGESDSEESIALEDATTEDLERMDGALAKVFAIKKVAKDEDNATLRGIMRTLRLIDMVVLRNMKCIEVGVMLIILMPVVNCLKASLKLKKYADLTTRVIGVLDNLCRVKKFSGWEGVGDGVVGGVAADLFIASRERKLKVLRELMEHCVVLLLRCFVGGKRGKKDGKAFLGVFCDAVDEANLKLRRRKKRRGSGSGGGTSSRFVRVGLEAIGGLWEEGRSVIEGRVKEVGGDV